MKSVYNVTISRGVQVIKKIIIQEISELPNVMSELTCTINTSYIIEITPIEYHER